MYLDSIGQEVRVGDIIRYSTVRSGCIRDLYAVILDFIGCKPQLYKVEKRQWNTASGKHEFGVGVQYIGADPNNMETIELRKVTLDGTSKVLVITRLDLPMTNSVFAQLRNKSNELLN